MNLYTVTLWKFDEHHYKETEVTLKYSPEYVPQPKPSILGVLLVAWRSWRVK